MSTEISIFNGCSNCTFTGGSITIVRSNMNAGPGVVPPPSPASTARAQNAQDGSTADYAELRVSSDISISARPAGVTIPDNATKADDVHHSASSPIGQDAPGGRSAGRGPSKSLNMNLHSTSDLYSCGKMVPILGTATPLVHFPEWT